MRFFNMEYWNIGMGIYFHETLKKLNLPQKRNFTEKNKNEFNSVVFHFCGIKKFHAKEIC